MIDVQYNPPPIHGLDFSNPDHVRNYELSQNKAIQAALEQIRRAGNNPKYIRIGGESLQKVVTSSKPWPGQLKLLDGTLANARSWGRKYGWDVCDGTRGTTDYRTKFLRGAATGKNAGASGGSATHTHCVATIVHSGTITHSEDLGTCQHNTSHTHGGTTGATGATTTTCGTGGKSVPCGNHTHGFTTGSGGCNHSHSMTGGIDDHDAAEVDSHAGIVTGSASSLSPYYDVIILRKSA